VFRKFASSVHHPSSSPKGSFFLVAILCRYLFRLTEESVSMALHCCLRGTLASFHVTYLQDRHFCFSVVSKVWVFWFELSKESPQIILMFIFTYGEMVVKIGSKKERNGNSKKWQAGHPLLASITRRTHQKWLFSMRSLFKIRPLSNPSLRNFTQ